MIHELAQPGSGVLALDCLFPEARAVIEGTNPGWVFVDDPRAPSAALVWARGMEGCYLLGSADSAGFLDELDAHIAQVLTPRLRDLGVACLEISGDETWNPVVEKVFANRNLESNQQWIYTLGPTAKEPVMQTQAIGDHRLRKIDRHLLAGLSAGKDEFLFSKLTQFWGDVDAFLKAGLGYSLVEGEEIASLCFSAFVVGETHVIDIETGARHRRKGYAERVARAFIAECLEKQLWAHWDCMAENMASVRLAEKLGLARSHEYTLYSFPLPS